MDWLDFRIHKRLSLRSDIIEKVYETISVVEGVKNSWKITTHLLPQTLDRLTRSVIITSTGSSNRIEGNCLSDQQVEDLYKNLRVKKFKTRDEQEIAGYLSCLEVIFKNYKNIKLSESFILSLHKEMLAHSYKDELQKGSYKLGSNRVEARDHDGGVVGIIFDPTPPYLVQKEMHELIQWYDWAIQTNAKNPLILIANFIFEFLAIHPFQDGNGRMSRLLSNLMLLQTGYIFTHVVSHERIIESNKVDYYLALNKTQQSWKTDSEDISEWLLFFLNIILVQSQQAQKIIEGDNIEYLLSHKQLELWKWCSSLNIPFSRKDAVAALGFSERTVESIIKKFVDYRKLQRVGQGSATQYRVLHSKDPTP
jgi:Fic family protein